MNRKSLAILAAFVIVGLIAGVIGASLARSNPPAIAQASQATATPSPSPSPSSVIVADLVTASPTEAPTATPTASPHATATATKPAPTVKPTPKPATAAPKTAAPKTATPPTATPVVTDAPAATPTPAPTALPSGTMFAKLTMLAPVTHNGHLYPVFSIQTLPGSACSVDMERVVGGNPTLEYAGMFSNIGPDGYVHSTALTAMWNDYVQRWPYSAPGDDYLITGYCNNGTRANFTPMAFRWTADGAV